MKNISTKSFMSVMPTWETSITFSTCRLLHRTCRYVWLAQIIFRMVILIMVLLARFVIVALVAIWTFERFFYCLAEILMDLKIRAGAEGLIKFGTSDITFFTMPIPQMLLQVMPPVQNHDHAQILGRALESALCILFCSASRHHLWFL